MNRIARTAAVSLTAAAALLATTTAASAQTDAQYNRHLVHRYSCDTAGYLIWRTVQPSTIHGWLVVDFFRDRDQRWIHVERADYPSLRALRADDLYPMAVCKR